MKKIIIILFFAIINCLFAQSELEKNFKIGRDSIEKSVVINMNQPIIIQSEGKTLSLSLYRNIYLQDTSKRFKDGYIYIAVFFNINPALISNSSKKNIDTVSENDYESDVDNESDDESDNENDDRIEIVFNNGQQLMPYVNFLDDEDQSFFSIENNIYKKGGELDTKEDDYEYLSKLHVKSIQIIKDDVLYCFDLTEDISRLLLQNIKFIGDYKVQ